MNDMMSLMCDINLHMSFHIIIKYSSKVDVIHTNGLDSDGTDSYGTLTVLGDIDFYPNGADIQPSCPGAGNK